MVKLVTNGIIKHKDLHKCLSFDFFFHDSQEKYMARYHM